MIYNTCLTPSSYDELPEATEAEVFSKKNKFRYEHIHRKWEYGMALKFAREIGIEMVLNIGGGNSPLSSLLVENGASVVEVDPNIPDRKFPGIEYIDLEFPQPGIGRYKLVVCTSVIEHVKDDNTFFVDLLDHSYSALFITMDFHPSGRKFSDAHERTYNSEKIVEFIELAKREGFLPYGEVHYDYKEPMVYDYTFAALALTKG